MLQNFAEPKKFFFSHDLLIDDLAAWPKCPLKSCVSAWFQAGGWTKKNAHGIAPRSIASCHSLPHNGFDTELNERLCHGCVSRAALFKTRLKQPWHRVLRQNLVMRLGLVTGCPSGSCLASARNSGDSRVSPECLAKLPVEMLKRDSKDASWP